MARHLDTINLTAANSIYHPSFPLLQTTTWFQSIFEGVSMFIHLYQKEGCTTGTMGMTVVAPKFSVTLTLFQSGGADSTHHWHGCT